jgi:hypothetical protein
MSKLIQKNIGQSAPPGRCSTPEGVEMSVFTLTIGLRVWFAREKLNEKISNNLITPFLIFISSLCKMPPYEYLLGIYIVSLIVTICFLAMFIQVGMKILTTVI